jgi:hypothetical protein
VSAADTAYVVWTYTGGAASGSLFLTVPAGTASGQYNLRLFAQNGWTKLATSGTITVTP